MGSCFLAPLRAVGARAGNGWRLSVRWPPGRCAPWRGPTRRDNITHQPVYACQLSVLNGGWPRGTNEASEQPPNSRAASSTPIAGPFAAERAEFGRDRWLLIGGERPDPSSLAAAAPGKGLPIAGDFNGDGRSETGLFLDGQWFIDLNGNGAWDRDDLWAQLGAAGDFPLVGDWDGDGKDDIGIYGPAPAWLAVTNDGGLPDAENAAPSGAPSTSRDQSDRAVWLVKQGASGALRAAKVDHVFLCGREPALAVAGDFNGDGIDTIALVRDGRWSIDVDGDGSASAADIETDLGQAGDRPIAGDFDGDGTDEIGVYRDGRWLIARRLADPAGDETTFDLGGPRLLPVVGDFDGDGQDEPAVYWAK